MRFPLAVLFSFATFTTWAQSTEEAITLLNQNKREEAKAAFLKVPATSTDYLNALLGLSVIDIDNGNFDGAFDHFVQFFQSHPNPYPYVYALWYKGVFSNNTVSHKPAVQAFMKKLMEDAKAPLCIRAMAASNIADGLFENNNIKEARQVYSRLNDIRNWATVGMFENISASGFNKDFGVVEHPESDYVFKNHIGAPVKWFNISDARNDRWLDLEYNYYVNNSVIYSQTFLQSETDQEVVMLLGVSGSVKVWINDFQVVSESEERNTGLDVYNYGVKLHKGNNRILIQLGASEINRSNFMLRFADKDGNLLTNFKTTQAYSPYNKETAYEVKKFPFFAEQYFEEKIVANTASFFDKLLLSSVYGYNEKRYECRKITQQLKTAWPKSTLVSEALTGAYSRDNNNTDLTREYEFMKSNDPESLIALMLLYEDAIKKEDYDEANKLLQQRQQVYGVTEETTMQYIKILSEKKDYENLLKEAEKAYKTYPDNASFTQMEFNIAQNVNKDVAKASQILEKYLKTHYDEDVTTMLMNARTKLGKKEEVFQLYNTMIQAKPYAIGWYEKVAGKYYDMQDYNKAIEWQQKAVEKAPYIGSYYYTEGLMYDAAGKKQEAISCFKKAIQYAPSNYDARRKLRELEGKKDLFTTFKENNIDSIYKHAPKADAYPNDNSIYLLKDVQQIIYPENGASEEKSQLVIKIFNQAGIDAWKEISIPYNSYTERLIISKAELLKKDGSKVQAETNDNQVVFSSLEIGDAIHVNYKLESASYGKLSEHFWDEFSFNGSYPVKVARYNLLVPVNRKFDYRIYNSSLQPVITTLGDDYKLYHWEKEEMPRIESESLMPSYSDIRERIVISSIPDWNYIANWYSDLSNIKVKADFEIKEKVKELLQGKEQLTGIEKAKIIYNHIEENFNYSDVPFLHSALTPQRASRTLNSRLGDCKDLSVLFTSMAKEAGLDANLVLVDTRNEGDKNVDMPVIRFNHCIAQLKTGGKTYFIELTDNQLPFGAMPNNVINANGLSIPKDGAQTTQAELVKLNTVNRTQNTIDRLSTVTFADNKILISRVFKKAGAETSGTRNSYRDQSEDDKRKAVTRSLSSEFNNQLSLKDFTITNLSNLEDSLTEKYTVQVDNYTSEIASMQIVKLPWADAYSSLEFVALDKRIFPLNLWQFSSTPYDKEVMTVIFPAGKKLVEVPKNVSYSCPALSYNLQYTIKDDRLIATREVKYLKDVVPVEEYATFKEIVSKMTEADKKQLAFK